jgi:hypothetical protein
MFCATPQKHCKTKTLVVSKEPNFVNKHVKRNPLEEVKCFGYLRVKITVFVKLLTNAGVVFENFLSLGSTAH